jgi:nucleoside-diphosphate-sugar epimerase
MSTVDNKVQLIVTGASGFLGSAIMHQAKVAGLRVKGIGRRQQVPDIFADDYCQVDILEQDELKRAMQGADHVIHAAGLAHLPYQHACINQLQQINVFATQSVARTAIEVGVKHLVLVSSVSVYGNHSPIACDETNKCNPIGAYAQSKMQAEESAMAITSGTGTALTILRMATLYGEGDPGNIARLIHIIDRGRFIWIGSGGNKKSLIYKEDAARACLTVLNRFDSNTRIYNVTAEPYLVLDIVKQIYYALNRRPPVLKIPIYIISRGIKILDKFANRSVILQSLKQTVNKWLADDVYDANRFEREFDFKTRVSLADGLRREVIWYKTIAHKVSCNVRKYW